MNSSSHSSGGKAGASVFTNLDLNFIAFCDDLRAHVEEHHHFPQKHSRLSHKVKYTRKKINEGTLEDWKREMFTEIAGMRDLTIHKGGRRKASHENGNEGEDENENFCNL